MGMNQRFMAKPVGSGTVFTTFSEDDMVIVYKPVLNEKQDMIIDSSGGAVVQRVGGVKAGTTGTIVGPSIRTPRRSLIEYANTVAPLGVDLVDLYPVQFDTYSGIGYLPGDAIKAI